MTTSLELLLPETLSRTADRPLQHPAIAAQLEDVCNFLIKCVNNRDWGNASVASMVSSNFRANFDGLGKSLSWDAYLDLHRSLGEKYPDYQMEILSISADVNTSAGSAEVYVFLEVNGMPTGVRRQSLSVFTWRYRGGTWMYVHLNGIRGVCEIFGDLVT